LLALPLDVLSVRLNADTAATYDKVMTPGRNAAAMKASGGGGFRRCLENLQWLLNTRNARWQESQAYPQARAGLPWIVPSLVKTHDTFADMETFFDRWMVYTGAAVIAPAQAGCGLMPAQSPVNMAPPRRKACRQIAKRLTILSDGRVALCDQDWLGQASPGEVGQASLIDLQTKLLALRQVHEQGRWHELALCPRCDEWHRL
jgi:hypothetical protein